MHARETPQRRVGGDQKGIIQIGYRWAVGEFDGAELLNAHPLLDGNGHNVDPPRCALLSDGLSTEDAPGLAQMWDMAPDPV